MSAPVSVIIPCYNNASTIERAVVSVFNQTLKPAEIIAINDGSKDETLEVLEKLQTKFGSDWLKIVNLTVNSGQGYARNVGWESATQPYIAFLDADDAWHPQKLEIQFNFMKQNPEIAISGHKIKVVLDDKFEHSPIDKNFTFFYVDPKKALFKIYFLTSTVMLKSNLPFRFPPERRFQGTEDYYLWLSIILSGYKGAFFDLEMAYSFKPLYGFGGESGRLWKMERRELAVYRDFIKKGKIPPTLGLLAMVFSILKFIRRVFITLLWKLRRQIMLA